VLAIGLVAVGIGTAVFLRNAQIDERDKSITQTVTLDQASSLLNVEVIDGVAQFGPPATAPLTSFYIAVYGPDGTLLQTGGAVGGPPEPTALPRAVRPRQGADEGHSSFDILSVDGKTTFHAAVDVLQLPGSQQSYVQLLALR
jgi:two-component system OmpR family sensor kinase